VSGEAIEGQPEHDFRRSGRPLPLALDLLEALQEAAHVDQDAA
jgi:hypothetical protein